MCATRRAGRSGVRLGEATALGRPWPAATQSCSDRGSTLEHRAQQTSIAALKEDRAQETRNVTGKNPRKNHDNENESFFFSAAFV